MSDTNYMLESLMITGAISYFAIYRPWRGAGIALDESIFMWFIVSAMFSFPCSVFVHWAVDK